MDAEVNVPLDNVQYSRRNTQYLYSIGWSRWVRMRSWAFDLPGRRIPKFHLQETNRKYRLSGMDSISQASDVVASGESVLFSRGVHSKRQIQGSCDTSMMLVEGVELWNLKFEICIWINLALICFYLRIVYHTLEMTASVALLVLSIRPTRHGVNFPGCMQAYNSLQYSNTSKRGIETALIRYNLHMWDNVRGFTSRSFEARECTFFLSVPRGQMPPWATFGWTAAPGSWEPSHV